MSGIVTGGYGPSARAGWNAVFGYSSGQVAPAGPGISYVINSGAGQLTVFFTQSMEDDAAYEDVDNYVITPLAGYTPIVITSIATQPDRVVINFTGGPGAYQIVISNVRSQADVVILPGYNTAMFFVSRPGLAPQTTIRVFNTALGPIGLRQIVNAQPTIEDLMQQRCISQGVTMQVNNVLGRLAGSGLNRDKATIAFSRLG